MAEPELEEGEACRQKDDTSIDPDIALSYIDEKLQNVLGHFQKDFEGGLCAENLGAKFGGYGSFLPMHQCPPSVQSHPKTPQRSQNNSTPKSPNNFHLEGVPQKSLVPSDVPLPPKHRTTSLGMHLFYDPKVASVDGLVKTDSCLLPAEAGAKVPAKQEPSLAKSVDPTDQKTPRVQIKMGSDKAAQKNAAIYIGLGLTSPSSSMGHSPKESGGEPFEPQDTLDESPASILECMTSFPVSGSVLLSPLHGSLLWLLREENISLDSKSSIPVRDLQKDSTVLMDNSASMLGNGKVSKDKKTKSVVKTETLEETKRGDGVHYKNNMTSLEEKTMEIKPLNRNQCFSNDLKVKLLSIPIRDPSDSLKAAGRTLEAHREADKDVPLKKRDVSKNSIKDKLVVTSLAEDEFVESIIGRDGAKHEQRGSRSRSIEKFGEQRGSRRRSIEKFGEHGVRSSEKEISVDLSGCGRTKRSRVPTLSKPELDVSKSEKDSKRGPVNHLKPKVGLRDAQNEQDRTELSQVAKKFSLESKNKSKGRQSNSKSTSKLAGGSFRLGSHIPKSKKSAQKDVAKFCASYEDVLNIRLGYMANQMNPLERPSGDRAKDYNLETVKEKDVTDDGPLTKELSSEMELASVAPVTIDENWVQCDSCEKWRLLPYGTKPDQLPDEWCCSMQNWLPGMNSCDISEGETEKAIHALYQPVVPLPESCNNFQSHSDRIAVGVASADVQSFNHKYQIQNLSSDAMPNQGKKKLKAKEIPNTGTNCGLIQNSSLTNNLGQQGMKRSDRNQPLLKMSLINDNTAQRPDKSSKFSVKRYADKQKEKEVDEGATNCKKLKAKKESVNNGYDTSNRTKTEDALHSDEYWNSENGGNLGRVGLSSGTVYPTSTTTKDLQKRSENHYSKDEKHELKDRLLISSRKQMGFPDSGSLEMKTCNEREIYAKKRKLKDWEDSRNSLETLRSNVSYLPDGRVYRKEENDNREYRMEKKSQVSRTEVQESRTSRGDDRSNEKGTVTRILLSISRDNSGVKIDRQQHKHGKFASQLTLDDVDTLKKDLGSEQFPLAATSSSSKVSDSHKRSSNQEVKGSPVESVSSSPMRTSNVYKVSSARRGSSGKNNAKIGDSPVMGAPRKSVERKISLERNRTGTARKGEASSVLQTVSFGCPGLEDHDGSGKAQSSVKPPSDFKTDHLLKSDDGTLTEHHPYPIDVHAPDHCHEVERMNTKHNHNNGMFPQKSGKGSSLLSRDKGKSSHNAQRVSTKISDPLSDQEFIQKNIQRDELLIDNHQLAPHHELIDAKKYVSDGISISRKDDKNFGMKGSRKWSTDGHREIQMSIREHDGSNANFVDLHNLDGRVTLQQNSDGEIAKQSNPTQVESRFGKPQVNPCHTGNKDTLACVCQRISGSLKGSGLYVQAGDSSGDILKVLQPANSVLQNGAHQSVGNTEADQSLDGHLTVPNPVKGNIPSRAANDVLKEAEHLKGCAYHLENYVSKSESNAANFQAAWKDLLGASLLETSKYESSKHVEITQMQIYNSTAKLFETCAHEFEKHQEMAAAALAYKCMEVAYMRIVYCKSSSTNKDRHDLQASLQMVPQGESPSSSASDVDNLNNHVTVDKAALFRVTTSNAGNHVIVAQNRPSFVQLLDFTNDVSSAMEASRKSQIAFAAANVALEKAQNNEGVISVKRVIDFAFQDLEEFLRLVGLATEAISLQCFSGNRD